MALTFNGSSAKLVSSASPVTAFPFSLFAWIKPSSTTVTGMAIGLGNGSGNNEVAAYPDGSNGVKLHSRTTSGTSNSLVATTSQQASWQPVLVVYENTTTRRIYYSSGAVVLTTISTSDSSPSTFTRMAVGVRPSTGTTLYFNGDIAEVAIWDAALGQTEFDLLAGGDEPETVAVADLVDAWTLATYNATSHTGVNSTVLTVTGTSQAATHPITRAGASELSGEAVMTGMTASGGMATAGTSELSGEAVMTGMTAEGGMGAAPGVLTTPVLKNNTGTTLASVTIPKVAVIRVSDMVQVLTLTSQTTSGAGVLTITNAAITAGLLYLLITCNADGTAFGCEPITAT